MKASSDDKILIVNGEKVRHLVDSRIQPDTGANITDIETAEGPVGSNVGPTARGRPGSGSFSIRTTSPDLARLAELSAAGDEVTIVERVVKNFERYSYSEVVLGSCTLGPVPTGIEDTVPAVNVTFRGTGYRITPRDSS